VTSARSIRSWTFRSRNFDRTRTGATYIVALDGKRAKFGSINDTKLTANFTEKMLFKPSIDEIPIDVAF